MLVNSNGTLVIRNSSVKDSGNYTCAASSRSGQDNATSSVTVVGKSGDRTMVRFGAKAGGSNLT